MSRDDSVKLDVVFATPANPEDPDNTASHALYQNPSFRAALFDSLGSHGILVVAQAGETASTFSSRRDFSVGKLLDEIAKDADSSDSGGWYESFHVYDEMVPREMSFSFGSSSVSKWATVIACKRIDCRDSWFNDAAVFDVYLRRALLPSTTSSSSLVSNFDGATMMTYQTPHKAFETSFCADVPDSFSCRQRRGVPPDTEFVPLRDLELRSSTIPAAGLGLFTKVDVPAGALVAIDQSLDPALFRPITMGIMSSEILVAGHPAFDYAEWYGYDGLLMTREVVFVETSLLSFANHGCQGSYNLVAPTDDDDEDEECGALWTKLHEFSPGVDSYFSPEATTNVGYGYDPVVDRHLVATDNRMDVARRDLRAGEELFTNYLPYSLASTEWLDQLRSTCG